MKKALKTIRDRAEKLIAKIKNGPRYTASAISKTFDLRDAFVFGGTGLIFIGTWQIYPPAAYIVTGALLFWVGIRKVK